MSLLIKLFHATVFLPLLCGIYYDHYILEAPHDTVHYKIVHEVVGGRCKFLTYLDMIFQCVFFGVCVLADLLGWNDSPSGRKSSLHRFYDAVFTTLVFPLGLFVSIIFWGLYAVDRELIFPASMDSWFPFWLNHVMHTLPAFACLLELSLVPHHLATGLKSYLPIFMAFAAYLYWLCYIAYTAGIWVYPVFEVLNFNQRSVFLAALLLPNIFLEYLGQKIHQTLWGSPKDIKKKGKRN